MPEPIPDTPENVLKALIAPWPPKKPERKLTEVSNAGD